MYLLAEKFGMADQMFKSIKVNGKEPYVEDVTAEKCKACGLSDHTGQTPGTAAQAHGEPAAATRRLFRRRVVLVMAITTVCRGRAGDSGNEPSRDTDPLRSFEAGLRGRTYISVLGSVIEPDNGNLLAVGPGMNSDLKDGYPEFTMAMLKKLGWDQGVDRRGAEDHREYFRR